MEFNPLPPSHMSYALPAASTSRPESGRPQAGAASRAADSAMAAPLEQLMRVLAQTREPHGESPAESEPGEVLPVEMPVSEDQRALQESLRQLELHAQNSRKLLDLLRLEIIRNDKHLLRRHIFVDIFDKYRIAREVASDGPAPSGFEGVPLLPMSPAEINDLIAALAADESLDFDDENQEDCLQAS